MNLVLYTYSSGSGYSPVGGLRMVSLIANGLSAPSLTQARDYFEFSVE